MSNLIYLTMKRIVKEGYDRNIRAGYAITLPLTQIRPWSEETSGILQAARQAWQEARQELLEVPHGTPTETPEERRAQFKLVQATGSS
jgi:hypothetical protein